MVDEQLTIRPDPWCTPEQTQNFNRKMISFYAARIEDLGPGDFLKVDCGACHHTLLTAAFLSRLNGPARVAAARGRADHAALRAAAASTSSSMLATFGMVVVVRVFAAYRDGTLADDDEVAVLHGPEALGYPAVTEAMVNIRATLERAAADGVVTHALASRLGEIGKALFYKERSWEAIFRRAAAAGLPPGPLAELAGWLPSHGVDRKRGDALEMVAAIRAHLAAGITPMTVAFRFRDTGYHKTAARQASQA